MKLDTDAFEATAKTTSAYEGESVMGGWDVRALGEDMLDLVARVRELEASPKLEQLLRFERRAEAAEAVCEAAESVASEDGWKDECLPCYVMGVELLIRLEAWRALKEQKSGSSPP